MFDFSSTLKGVSSLNTRDRIDYIGLDQIDPDERNFYSLDGLDELAASIELVGLQQPIRVRKHGERYTVVSGHRRRAACMIIRDGGSDMFADGVPCIVETGDVSAELQELRLIYANSATRVLSPAETSRQIERVTELLYQLKKQGVEFPGRMRDHVAEACNVSKTKIARLNAIRSNLCPGFLKQFDSGILSETAAYELQKLPADVQEALANEKWLAKRRGINASCAENCVKLFNAEKKELMCPGGADCTQPETERLKFMAYSQYSWHTCDGGCCLKCYKRPDCSYRCAKCRDEDKEKAKAEKQKEAERKTRETLQQAERREKIKRECQRFLPLIEAAGLKDDDRIVRDQRWIFVTPKEVRAYAVGDLENKHFYSDRIVTPDGADAVTKMAKQLNCSADFVCGLTDDPTPASERVSGTDTGWITDRDPEESGEYVLWYGNNWIEVNYYNADSHFWHMWKDDTTPLKNVHGWMPLPEIPGVKE